MAFEDLAGKSYLVLIKRTFGDILQGDVLEFAREAYDFGFEDGVADERKRAKEAI